MVLPEISTALTAFKTLSEIAKTILQISKDPKIKQQITELQGIILDLQSQILSMQSEHGKLLDVKADLEKKLMEYEQWDKEKANYVLTEISTGVFAYSRKKNQKSAEPDHWLCARCFEDKRKSILQSKSSSSYFCPGCGTELHLRDRERPFTPPSSKKWI